MKSFSWNVLTGNVNFVYNILLNVQILGITWKRDHSFGLTRSQVGITPVTTEHLLKWVVWKQMLCLKVCKSLMRNVFNPLMTCGNERLHTLEQTSAAYRLDLLPPGIKRLTIHRSKIWYDYCCYYYSFLHIYILGYTTFLCR